jgi:predicted phosphodiesterase
MARYGVIADVHGNLEALRAVLALLDARAVERVVCLGDIVGFNADPDSVVGLLRERGVECIAGNHDLIGIGRLGFDRCADHVAYAIKRTRRTISPDTAAFLATLPATRLMDDGFALIHGGVDDVEQYVTTPEAVRDNAARLQRRFPGTGVCFFGHTHRQGAFEVHEGEAREVPPRYELPLSLDRLYFVNPGSVDAARKHSDDKFAECAVFDSTARSVEFHRVPYDHETAEAKAVRGGYRMGRTQARWRRLQRRIRSATAHLAAALRASRLLRSR